MLCLTGAHTKTLGEKTLELSSFILAKDSLKFKEHETEVCEGEPQIGEKQVSVQFSSPFLKPVQNEEEILVYIKCLFFPEVHKCIMILFTCGDELEDLDQTIHKYLQNHADLQRLVTECGGKFHSFDNKSKSDNQMRRRHSMFSTLKIQMRLMSFLRGKTRLDWFCWEKPEQKKKNLFESSAGSNSEMKQSSSESSVRMGKEISVIHMPGFLDNLHETHSRELG
ncbi:Immune-associated nucleotide-binding protein 6 [Labeo rohita]|uniref:Immune-associated nucleotide-binding protein 6 n=1 Tax=Labeo rohita TaxID=84645 RepID=A0ABQ8MW95_LABRO|nr:Immune-associated nucleotide-binding protein 6 [Labeo rohita]